MNKDVKEVLQKNWPLGVLLALAVVSSATDYDEKLEAWVFDKKTDTPETIHDPVVPNGSAVEGINGSAVFNVSAPADRLKELQATGVYKAWCETEPLPEGMQQVSYGLNSSELSMICNLCTRHVINPDNTVVVTPRGGAQRFQGGTIAENFDNCAKSLKAEMQLPFMPLPWHEPPKNDEIRSIAI